MWVEGDGVALLDPPQERRAARGEPEEAAVGRVGVDPEAVLARDLEDLRQRVDGPRVGGADVGDDEERPPAPRAVRADGLLQGRRDEPQRASVGSSRRLAPGKPRGARPWSRSGASPGEVDDPSWNASPSRSWRAVTIALKFESEPPEVRMPRAPAAGP